MAGRPSAAAVGRPAVGRHVARREVGRVVAGHLDDDHLAVAPREAGRLDDDRLAVAHHEAARRCRAAGRGGASNWHPGCRGNNEGRRETPQSKRNDTFPSSTRA